MTMQAQKLKARQDKLARDALLRRFHGYVHEQL
jgi:hypothetical protein